MIHDYGLDFQKDLGTTINLPMLAITQENIEKYQEILANQNWIIIDFRRLSKIFNPSITSYDFSISNINNEYNRAKEFKRDGRPQVIVSEDIDKDLDRVPNMVDQCPDSVSGTTVTNNGCSIAFEKHPFQIMASSQSNKSALVKKGTEFFVWGDTMQHCHEMNKKNKFCLEWDEKNEWFGAGFKNLSPINLSPFKGKKIRLKFRIKIPGEVPFKVGILDSSGNTVWVEFPLEIEQFGFRHTGEWEEVSIPISAFTNGLINLGSLDYAFTLLNITDNLPQDSFQLQFDYIIWDIEDF
ncbi:MAG: hypothetical protein ACI93R_002402 [Flavobacteriales bacterium]|jgi:hypothetical protein